MKTSLNRLTSNQGMTVLTLVLLAILAPSFVRVTAQDPEPGPVCILDDNVINSIAGKLHATIALHSIEADVAAIEKVLNQYAVAVNAGDLDLWLSLHSEDVVKMGPDAPTIFGRDDLQANFKPIFDTTTSEMALYPEETQVQGNLGFARGNYTLLVTPKTGGEPFLIDGKYLTICKRQGDGSWKISHDCYNSNVPPQ